MHMGARRDFPREGQNHLQQSGWKSPVTNLNMCKLTWYWTYLCRVAMHDKTQICLLFCSNRFNQFAQRQIQLLLHISNRIYRIESQDNISRNRSWSQIYSYIVLGQVPWETCADCYSRTSAAISSTTGRPWASADALPLGKPLSWMSCV